MCACAAEHFEARRSSRNRSLLQVPEVGGTRNIKHHSKNYSDGRSLISIHAVVQSESVVLIGQQLRKTRMDYAGYLGTIRWWVLSFGWRDMGGN